MKTLERCQWRRSSVYIVNCEHISNFVLIVDFEQGNICWVQIREQRLGISCITLQYFKREQNLLTNSIWTYTNTTLRVNHFWGIFAEEFTSDADSG